MTTKLVLAKATLVHDPIDLSQAVFSAPTDAAEELAKALAKIDELTKRLGPPTDSQPSPPNKRPKMTAKEANSKAMQLAKKMKKKFFDLSESAQAKLIGCHPRTWKKCPFYVVAKRKKPRTHAKSGSRHAVSFTPELEAQTVADEREEKLEELTEEQATDQRSRKVFKLV